MNVRFGFIMIETEVMALEPGYKGCRPYRCGRGRQQYDVLTLNLRYGLVGEAAYTCPGCLQGRVRALGPAGEQGGGVAVGQHRGSGGGQPREGVGGGEPGEGAGGGEPGGAGGGGEPAELCSDPD